MRKYIVDKLLVLTVIIGIMIVLPFASRSVTIIIVEIGLAIGYGYMCWRVLVFSLDFFTWITGTRDANCIFCRSGVD